MAYEKIKKMLSKSNDSKRPAASAQISSGGYGKSEYQKISTRGYSLKDKGPKK